MLPSGPVASMQTARTLMAPTHVPVKVDFMEMEKRVWVDPICYYNKVGYNARCHWLKPGAIIYVIKTWADTKILKGKTK